MIIKPVLQGNIARNCHPLGCQANLTEDYKYLAEQQPLQGAKKVLIIGASSGFGLAARMVLQDRGNADTIGISYEKGPSPKGLGTAGWYNNIYFKQHAEKQGSIAKNFIADAFQATTRQQVIDYIKEDFGGKIDLVIYSLAAGRRQTESGAWQSVLKTTDKPLEGYSLNLETDSLEPGRIDMANHEEISATCKVMGGDDWQLWIDDLLEAEVLAPQAKTIAFSYAGPDLTAAIYRDGTIGRAKQHLHATATHINQQLQSAIQGNGYACVCRALVTKASVYIPLMSPYIALLYKVMKQQGLHEECIQQCYRLFSQHLYPEQGEAKTDEQGQIRIDDWELSEAVQQEVNRLYPSISPDNFKQVTDYAGYKQQFMRLNGFEVANFDDNQAVDIEHLSQLAP